MEDFSTKAKKAESGQALKAFLIPLTLFLACNIAAAGSFLIYHHESLGWVFIIIAAIVIVLNIIALIQFQNKLRVKGIFPEEEADEDKHR